MNFKNLSLALVLAVGAFYSITATANDSRKEIRVNSDVTTHIVMPENLKLVDISTANIIGNQCADNMVRIKPTPTDSIDRSPYFNNEFLGTITLIGERHIAQYDIIYDDYPKNATSMFNVSYQDTQTYTNPEVSMPESEMARFAWAIYGSKRKFHNIKTNAYGIKAEIYNIYSIGNYFFIDFGLRNKSDVEYDIDEVRVTLTDKKETKATNSQTIQIKPVYSLNPVNRFKKDFRQVLVLDKLTFPDEKVINITFSENQISGRQITLSMEYSDVLNADGFDISKAETISNVKYVQSSVSSGISANDIQDFKNQNYALQQANESLQKDLRDKSSEILRLNNRIKDLSKALSKMEAAYKGANETIEKILANDKK